MRRLKNILVAMDGSPSSFHALEESIRLAQWGKGGVAAITVAPPYEGDLSLVGVKNIKAAIEGPSEEILGRALGIAEARSSSLEVICEEGEVHRKIVEHAEARRCDLIVLGASSRKSWAGSLLGSTASRVIEHSSRDVLVIPEDVPVGWERILLATDGSQYGKSSRELALELAVSYGGELKTVFLPIGFDWPGKRVLANSEAESAGEAPEAFKARAEQAGIRCDLVAARGRGDRVVHDLAERHEVSLIILGLQMRKRLLGLIPGSVVDSYICCSNRPVLVVKAQHCSVNR